MINFSARAGEQAKSSFGQLLGAEDTSYWMFLPTFPPVKILVPFQLERAPLAGCPHVEMTLWPTALAKCNELLLCMANKLYSKALSGAKYSNQVEDSASVYSGYTKPITEVSGQHRTELAREIQVWTEG